MPNRPRQLVKTTCPRDCYDACGIVVAVDEGGIRKVLGDPDHHVARGALCGKCAIAYNGVWRDPGARLQHPLKRVGPKGRGSFEPISWDEALDLVVQRLMAPAGRLRIISPASAWQLNSSYANDPGILRQIGELAVHLHPADAARHGLVPGDQVRLSNAAGRLTLKIDVSDIVQPGTGLIYKGRWPSREAGAANVNILHRGQKSDIGQSTSVHSTEVEILRVESAG